MLFDTVEPASRDIRGECVFLGTGTSVGVPVVGCSCEVCLSGHPKNQRTRSSVIVGLPEGNLLIDTGPDLRQQLLDSRIGVVHGVLYTHDHADHIMGLDDVRIFFHYTGQRMPMYCEGHVEARIRRIFDYAFQAPEKSHSPGAVPQLDLLNIRPGEPFQVLGAEVMPIRLQHGRFDVLGFRIGDWAYCTDTNHIPEESMELLQGVKTFIVDALRPKPHPTHFSVDEAIEIAAKLGAESTYFTHISHTLDHEATQKGLPDGVFMAYDGLSIQAPL